MERYTDDTISHIESDIEKIQVKPNMYISYSGSKGALHLFKEGCNNNIDEGINPNSPCDKVDIYINLTDNTIVFSDNGRGIPFEDMMVACTKLQSGSKFSRATSLGSAGENGVGLTAMNALSERFIIVSEREGKKKSLVFEEGVLVKEKEFTTKNRGLTVSFTPSKRFLGKCNLPQDEVEAWLEDIQHMLPKKFTINLTMEKKGKTIVKREYKNKKGMLDVVQMMVKDPVGSPIHLSGMTHIMEEATDYAKNKMVVRTVERFLGIEFAFVYDEDLHDRELAMRSFCNFVSTIDHGVHADAVRSAIQSILVKATKETLSEKEAKRMDITFNDVSAGLRIALYLSTDHQVHFASQTKEKVSNKELFGPIKGLVTDALNDYFKKNPNVLKRLVTCVKNNAKMRLASLKAKRSVLKDEMRGSLKDYNEKSFVPANNKGKKDYRELIIIEGDSAGALAKMGRYDPDTQALFYARGNPFNAHEADTQKVLGNAELKLLILKLGCNIGERFNLANLWYDKIIIMSDADIDGLHIDAGYRAFFYRHMRPLVEAGKLYRVLTPLYKIKGKKNKPQFLLNKEELAATFTANVRDHMVLIDPSGKELKKGEMEEFFFINEDYNQDLINMADSRGINHRLLELLLLYWHEGDYDEKKLQKVIRKKFPEISIEDQQLTGIIDGQEQALRLDEKVYRQLEDLRRYFALNKSPIYDAIIEGKKHKDLTISEIMTFALVYHPQIITRYKGIGELNPDEIRDVAMNPNHRKLLQICIEDEERTDYVFDTLFAESTKKDIDERRKRMIRSYRIPKQLLDN